MHLERWIRYKNDYEYSVASTVGRTLFAFSAFHLFFLGRSFNGMRGIKVHSPQIITFDGLNSLSSTDLETLRLDKNYEYNYFIIVEHLITSTHFNNMLINENNCYLTKQQIIELIKPTALVLENLLYN